MFSCSATMTNAAVPMVSLLCLIILTFGYVHTTDNYDYSHADCTHLKEDEGSPYFGGRCFCYSSGTVIKWNDFWSTFQVQVTSADDVRIIFPLPGDGYPGPWHLVSRLRRLVAQYWPWGAQGDPGVHIPLVDKEVCFAIQAAPSARYTLGVTAKRVNWMHFGLSVCGVILFLFAGMVCRSTLFYCVAGVSLGMLSMLVFLLLVLKGFIQKTGLFLVLLGVSLGLSCLGLQLLWTHWDQVQSLYRKELLGYLLLSSTISLAVCCKTGSITEKPTLAVLTWVLRAGGLGLIYLGVVYTPAAHVTAGVLLGIMFLPVSWMLLCGLCGQAGRPFRSALGLLWCRQPQLRLLTEEEYREQGEKHTRASLEELRQHCSRPGFPAWDTVLRLRYPQRFAEFLRSGSHVSAEESQSHDQQYGIGGAFFEDMIFCSGYSGSSGVRRPSSQLGVGDDVIADEPGNCESGLHSTPSLPPLSTTYSPSSQVGPLAVLPLGYTPPLCPYPSAPYIPPSEPMDMEEPF